MTTKLTPEERTEITSLVNDVARTFIAAIAPQVIEMIAAAKPNIRYTRIGEHCVIEPVNVLEGLDLTPGTLTTLDGYEPVRDYRKQLWIATYSDYYEVDPVEAAARANTAVATFDEAFSK